MGKDTNKYNIYVWGAGIEGRTVQTIISICDCFMGYIDNNAEKQYKGWCGEKVYSLEQYLNECEPGIIVISANKQNAESIAIQLKHIGLCEGEDYYYAELFLRDVLPTLMLEKFNELIIPLVQISLTERCTLKCRKCAHACYNVRMDAPDLSIEDVKLSADFFFSKVDKAGEFVLIGGEPFLYKELEEAICYIGSRYRSRIGVFTITTNGTIIPNEKVLQLCKKYDVLLRISNYSQAVPALEDRYIKLTEILNGYNIRYILGDEKHTWIDYGFGEFDRGESAGLSEVFKKCKTNCREIRKNHLYYCVMARSVSDNLNMGIGRDDYLDLILVTDKKQILDFHLGKVNKGYLDMCRYCRGKEAESYIIPAAEQVTK